MTTPSPQPESDIARAIGEHYDVLREIAAQRLRRERTGEISATSVVHEAGRRLLVQRAGPQNDDQFLAIASTMMLRVVVDRLRKLGATRRHEAGAARAADADEQPADEGVTECVRELCARFPRQAEAFVLNVVCGTSQERIAQMLAMSVPTVERDIRFARSWLASRLSRGGDEA
ncbi:MAG: ECF-type sigma factor [Phycisphaerales bacterium]